MSSMCCRRSFTFYSKSGRFRHIQNQLHLLLRQQYRHLYGLEAYLLVLLLLSLLRRPRLNHLLRRLHPLFRLPTLSPFLYPPLATTSAIQASIMLFSLPSTLLLLSSTTTAPCLSLSIAPPTRRRYEDIGRLHSRTPGCAD